MERKSLKSFCLEIRQSRYCLLLLFFLSSSLGMYAQNISVSGVITDDTGETVPGANIVIKGTSSGTASDLDGKYQLSTDAKAVLVFSSLGYVTQEIHVNGKTVINVKLKGDTKLLDEVVVVGYARVAKANLTGSVDQIKGDVLENRPVMSAAQALQGTVANLNISSASGSPNESQNINIRGYTGLGTAGSPLIVTDGVQGGNLQDINPNDIESISVLKDAASAAIYGSSAPHGVIIITTKKGKKGGKPKITYSNNFGWAQPINLPSMLNSLTFANLYNEASVNAKKGLIFDEATIQRIKDYQAGTLKEETMADPTPGANSWYSWDRGNANNDWFDIYYKDLSFAQQHNVGVSGGSENSNYYVGLGYNQKDGMYNFGNDKYQRFNVRSNLTSNLTDWLTFNFRGNFSRGLNDTPNKYGNKTNGNYMHQMARKWPTVPLKNPDGNYSETSDVLLQRNGGRDKSETDKVMLTGEFVATPLKGWDITFNYSYDGTFDDTEKHKGTVYEIRPDGASIPVSGTTPNSFSREHYKSEHQTINAFTSYERQIGDHYLKGLVGYTQELFNYKFFDGGSDYLYTDDIPAISLTYGTPTSSDKLRQLAVRGAFGRLNYGYKEKYLLEVNLRYDGTSRFMSDVRYKFYPGVSAAWVASKEPFWEPIKDIVNVFKLRGSYGSLGDQSFLDSDPANPSWYPFYPSLKTGSAANSNWLFSDGRQANVSNPGLINNLLTWVTTTTYDVGVDMEFLNNRLGFTFDWFLRKSDDFAGPAQALPGILGASVPNANNAAMETTGFDMTISWRDRIGEFGYGARFVLSDYKGKVTKYPNPTGEFITTDYKDIWYAGRQMGEIWGYETYGIFQSQEEVDAAPKQDKLNSQWGPGDVRYVDRDGKNGVDFGDRTLSNPGDLRVIGNKTPRYSYGLTLDANYKGFDFSIFFQGVAKRDVWFDSNYFWGINGDMWQSSPFTVHEDRWTQDNPGGYYPKFYMSTSQTRKNTPPQTRYLQDASYMRIKNIQLGYTLPASWLEKIKFDKVRVFVSAENVATFTNLIEIMDPEFSTSDGKIYPLQRTWSGGVNITF